MGNLSRKAREDREQKEADEILLRSDEPYLEIEQFKDYEFSWCIAFEMVKRDPILLQKVQKHIRFYKKYKQEILFIPFSIQAFEKDPHYRKHRNAKMIFEYRYDYFAEEYWISPIDLYHITGDETALEMAEVYAQLFQEAQEPLPNERLAIENDEGISFESYVNFNNEHYFHEKTFVSEAEIFNATKELDIDSTLIESNRKVIENFSRPKLSIPAIYNKNVELELNLALPEKELIAYVHHIKERYDRQKDLVKSPIELLGAELSSVGLEEVDAEQIYKTNRRKTLPEKCADLFFVYDCYANNLSMDYAVMRLTRYWYGENYKSKFQDKTYKRYLKTAKDFIENRKYQSLLIG